MKNLQSFLIWIVVVSVVAGVAIITMWTMYAVLLLGGPLAGIVYFIFVVALIMFILDKIDSK